MCGFFRERHKDLLGRVIDAYSGRESLHVLNEEPHHLQGPAIERLSEVLPLQVVDPLGNARLQVFGERFSEGLHGRLFDVNLRE